MKKLLVFLFLCVFLNAFAQITVELITPIPYFNYMGVNSFNPENPQNQPIFLLANILGSTTDPFKIKIQISWNDATAIVWLTPIPQNPPALPLNLTNQDLINNDPIGFSTSGNYDDFVDEIEDILLSTGKMPDGNYILDVGVYDLNEELISNIAMATLTIQSPQAIDLISPGSPFGLPLVPIGNQYPQFFWLSNFGEYDLFVYEIDENIQTPEEIESLDPYHQNSYPIMSNVYEYPSSSAPLLSGHTYAWQVTAETVTPMTSQNVTMKSPFYVFQVMQGGTIIPPIDPLILQNLINQFVNTGTVSGELLNLLQNGYNVQTIMWQGQEITLQELMNILNSGLYTPVE